MAATTWLRLTEDVDCGLRRGAWYEAVTVGGDEVVLQIEGKRRSYARGLFEISSELPTRWTIVSRAGNATRIPARWTEGYAVCPACRWRQLTLGHPEKMLCEGCYREFEVAWDEQYLEADQS